jgi:dihydrodipicolinate synthase/N-acetylneuraminate lyase
MTTDVLGDLAAQARGLVDDITAQAEREHAIEDRAWADGYRAGFDTGCDVGYARAHHEMDQVWRELAAYVRSMASVPTAEDIHRRRAEPGGPAYYAALLRHGGTEFGGVGKPRVPAPPGAYARALEWAKRQQGETS